ncbi:MAG TPA: Gfo/Idh/MocA family oxidoreductase [Firmicutes bacterium]|nr:Gfo/Idh/MocA family oxidoreductase [Bacillota bacterium]
MSANQIGLAIVGCGGIAQSHLGALKELSGARLAAAVDIMSERAEAVVKEHGGTAYTDLAEALQNPNVDACIICLPHHLHKEATIAACSAGKHVLVEKPMATNLADCRQMKAAADQAGVILMVGQVLRFRTIHRKAREILRAGEIGEVVNALRRRHAWHKSYEKAPWSKDPAKAGGWLLYGFGAHEYDMMLWLIGRRAERVFALGRRNNPHWQDYDEISSLIELEGQVMASVTQTLNCYTGAWDQIIVGTEGSMYISGADVLQVNRKAIEIPADPTHGMRAQLAEFIQAIGEGRRPEADAGDVLHTMALLEAVGRSIKSGAVETVDKLVN